MIKKMSKSQISEDYYVQKNIRKDVISSNRNVWKYLIKSNSQFHSFLFQKILKFHNGDRFIASRQGIRRENFQDSQTEFDILDRKNDLELMHCNRYKTQILNTLMNEESQEKKGPKLIKEDWKCKMVERKKFLPDYETMEKRSVGLIRKFNLTFLGDAG